MPRGVIGGKCNVLGRICQSLKISQNIGKSSGQWPVPSDQWRRGENEKTRGQVNEKSGGKRDKQWRVVSGEWVEQKTGERGDERTGRQEDWKGGRWEGGKGAGIV